MSPEEADSNNPNLIKSFFRRLDDDFTQKFTILKHQFYSGVLGEVCSGFT